MYPRELKAETLNRHFKYTSMVTAAAFTIAKIWKQPKWGSLPSADGWISNVWLTYTGILFSLKWHRVFPGGSA